MESARSLNGAPKIRARSAAHRSTPPAMVKGCPKFSPSAKASPMICPQTYRTHSGSSSERKALRFGAKSRAPGLVVGGLPWWAALRTLTGDVMRRAHWVGGIDRSEARLSCFASIKGEVTTPATLAKVINCATTLHRSSSRARRHYRRASGRAEAPTDGGRAPRPAAQKRPHAAKSAQACAPAETIARRGCGARRRRNERDPEGDAAAIDRPRHSETRGKWGNAAAIAMEGPAGGACPGGGRERLTMGLDEPPPRARGWPR